VLLAPATFCPPTFFLKIRKTLIPLEKQPSSLRASPSSTYFFFRYRQAKLAKRGPTLLFTIILPAFP
jgi:hypothetical protein